MRRLLLSLLLLTSTAAAQPPVVGQTVHLLRGGYWTHGQVIEVRGDEVHLQTGSGQYMRQWVKISELTSPEKEAAKEQERAVMDDFRRDFGRSATLVATLAQHKHPEKQWTQAGGLSYQFTEAQMKQYQSELRTVAAALSTGKYASYHNRDVAGTSLENDIFSHPDVWREIAADPKALSYLASAAMEPNLKQVAERLRTHAASLASDKGWIVDPYEVRLLTQGPGKARASLLAPDVRKAMLAAGQRPESLSFTELDAAQKTFLDEVARLAPTWKPSYGNNDPGIASRIAAGWRRNQPQVQVVQVTVRPGDWSIQRNALGAVLGRTKTGTILYRQPGCAYLIEKTWDWHERYAGGGRFVPHSRVQASTYRFLAR